MYTNNNTYWHIQTEGEERQRNVAAHAQQEKIRLSLQPKYLNYKVPMKSVSFYKVKSLFSKMLLSIISEKRIFY